MSDLTPEDEALLERARHGGGEATPDDHARVKRKLLAQVGIGVGASAMSTSGGASAGLTATSAAAKIVVALAIGMGAGTGVVMSYGPRTAHEPPARILASPAVPTSSPSVVQAPATTTGTIEPSEAPASESRDDPPRPIVRDHAPRPNAVPIAAAPNEPSSSPPPADHPASLVPPLPAVQLEPPGPATVAAEAELLRQADAALKGGRPANALALLGEHARQFPNGILVEEREAERIVVLCALGRTDDARAAASQFLRLRPRSPLSGRVRESCGGT
jgi:hypothetical protein